MDKRNLAFNVIALALYAVAANPAITGIDLHEWLGLGLLVAFVIHCALHVDAVGEMLRSAFAHPSWSRTGNLVLDVLILVVFMVATVSGIFISGAVLPSLGLYAEGYYLWDPLHAVSAKLLLALLLVHVVVHWRWVAHVLKGRRGSAHDE